MYGCAWDLAAGTVSVGVVRVGEHGGDVIVEAGTDVGALGVWRVVKPGEPEFVVAVVLFNVAVGEAVLSVVVVCHR